jgi:hypothetical protein
MSAPILHRGKTVVLIILYFHQLFEWVCDQSPKDISELQWIRLLTIQPYSPNTPIILSSSISAGLENT